MISLKRNPQNVLFVSPGYEWGTRERIVLKDALLLKELGHFSLLYCSKGSTLEAKAKENGLDCLISKGGMHISLFEWHKIRYLKSMIDRYNIGIVHCYDFDYLWPLAFFLRNRQKIPLFFTFNHDVGHIFFRFWQRPLLARIDRFFLPMRELGETLRSQLEIPLRKLTFIGLGVKHEGKVESLIEQSFWNIGCMLTSDWNSLEDFKTILLSLAGLNQKCPGGKLARLIVFSERGLGDLPYYKELMRLIEKTASKEQVELSLETEKEGIYRHIHLWVAFASAGAIEDYSVMGLVNLVPCLIPRVALSMEIFRQFGDIGQTYKAGDARELKDKLQRMLLEHESNIDRLKSVQKNMIKFYGHEFYKKTLLDLYESQLNKRLRLFSGKR